MQSETESLNYWKSQAKYYEQKAIDIQQELDEYTENSAQLEKELDSSLCQAEKQIRDLKLENQRLRNEIEMLQSKLERSQNETNTLENEVKTLKDDKEKQAVYIRELEQKNDDLERGHRVIIESFTDLETMLNQSYERNAVLENGIDEIERLKIKLQRATDEARDLKQELIVKEKILVDNKKEEQDGVDENSVMNGHISNTPRIQVETETQTIIPTPQKREINGNAMTPSSRVSAINIVGDILRRVGLEKFLCRECGKVKCSCEAAVAVAATNHGPPLTDADRDIMTQRLHIEEPVECRHTAPARQHSVSQTPDQHNAHTDHEQPFVRSTHTEGKMRRSFAVRSREGLENLLGFTALRKNNDNTKAKNIRQ